jgi:hypothetical protein
MLARVLNTLFADQRERERERGKDKEREGEIKREGGR